jgi:hypothetical protein
MPAKQPAPLGRYRNPFEFLKDADRQEQEKRADLERTGRLTDETAREIAEACRSSIAEPEPAGSGTPDEMGRLLMKKAASPLACVSLIVTEVTAKDFPSTSRFDGARR